MKLSVVIFDLNGTVLSDEDEYGEAFSKVLKGLGVSVSAKYPHVSGIGVEENWPIFIKKYSIKTNKTIQDLTVETQKEYFKLIGRVTLREGFEEFVDELKGKGVKIALATSNSWNFVEKIFDKFDIEHFFDCITCGEEVRYKKPDPEIFELTKNKLMVDPSGCLVIEDSQAGIKAAKEAGMKVVAVARDRKYMKLLKNADKIITDFTKLKFSDIEKL
jgi:beta-phosphoglucomutase